MLPPETWTLRWRIWLRLSGMGLIWRSSRGSPLSIPVVPSTPAARADTGRKLPKCSGERSTKCRVTIICSAVRGPREGFRVTTVQIVNEEGARALGKPEGTYVTLKRVAFFLGAC